MVGVIMVTQFNSVIFSIMLSSFCFLDGKLNDQAPEAKKGILKTMFSYIRFEYGTEQVSADNEQYIRAIAQEMGFGHLNFKIFRMNDWGISKFGYANACVVNLYLYKYLFISEGWFNELPDQEKRFVIGHELAHLGKSHHAKIMLASVGLAIGQEVCLGGHFAALGRYYDQGQWGKYCVGTIGTLGALCIFDFLLIAMLIRRHEREADYISATLLNNVQGGIASFEHMKEEELQDDKDKPTTILQLIADKLKGYFATHPSHDERLSLIQQYGQQQEQLITAPKCFPYAETS